MGRYTTGVWTYRYLTEQLQVALAGRAAEELVLGRDELSSLSQHRLQFARQTAFKMMNAGACRRMARASCVWRVLLQRAAGPTGRCFGSAGAQVQLARC